MALLTGIVGAVSVLVAWLVTARLFAISRRTRAAPAQLLATAFAGLFGVGYPLGAISRAPGLVETHQGSLLFALGTLGMVVGAAALNGFPQIVFRPGCRWAALVRWLATLVAVAAGLGSTICVAAANSREEMIETIQPWAVALILSIGLPFVWNGIESTLYYGRMKKRQKLGLARPSTTHTFLLWALASWGSAAQIGVIAAIRLAGQPIVAPLPMGIIAGCSLMTSACWSLAFFMPKSYRSKVLGESFEASPATD
ncbi:MAG: hypothetical protein CL908_09965 [Deltaproteobacteria bacterium]|jgi:hypothetical protein|nr:hypothetical protein [Deltaproteobacteria bacterium]